MGYSSTTHGNSMMDIGSIMSNNDRKDDRKEYLKTKTNSERVSVIGYFAILNR